MYPDVVVFLALKIKGDYFECLPEELYGWTSFEECSILCDLLLDKFNLRLHVPMYSLNRVDYNVNGNKITSLKELDFLSRLCAVLCSSEVLESILYDQELVKEFLARIKALYVNGTQKKAEEIVYFPRWRIRRNRGPKNYQ